MHCCISDLRNKDVINKKTGARIGNVIDSQIDTCTGNVVALVVCCRTKMGFFSRDECYVRWDDIDVIGDDIILVNCAPLCAPPRHKNSGMGSMEGFFR